MMPFPLPLLCVAILFGVAVPASAQVELRGSFGRHVHVSARIGDDCRPVVRRVPRCPPPPCAPEPCGRWQTVCEQVWVPGCFREEPVPAVWGWVRDHCGHRHWGIVRPACTRQVWVPGRYETRQRQVWVTG